MGTCEMCGEADTLKKTNVEDATLKLCEGCRDVGEVVEQPTSSGGARERRRTPSAPEEDVLPGYSEAVKDAREARGMSIAELADALKEKDSVVKRVESGRLTPDRDLARKFEQELDIDIYGEPPEAPAMTGGKRTGEQTLGDVARVHKN